LADKQPDLVDFDLQDFVFVVGAPVAKGVRTSFRKFCAGR